MIKHIVHFAMRNRALVLILAAAILAWGVYSFTQLDVEAYPDVMNTQVQIITQWPGHAAEEMERDVTLPLEQAFASVPKVQTMRSRALFGLSDQMLTFDSGVDDLYARDQVSQAIGQANLPNGVQASMQPMTSATGQIFYYYLTGAPVMELKSIQDWTLYRKIISLPGVGDCNGFGGTVKQYEIEMDPAKLKAFNVTVTMVENALANANANAGGSYLERAGEEYVVRGIGLLRGTDDIANVVLATNNGTPVYVRDIGTVRVGYAPRLGRVGYHPGGSNIDVDDTVMGIIDLRRGENPGPVLEEVRALINKLNTDGELPKGVRIVPYYDLTNLVHTTSHTVERNLLEGMILVVAILFLFLGNVRAATIVALTIPFSLLFAFSCLNAEHMSANLISLGAIDFGVIVNGSVILVENVFRRLATRLTGEGIMHSILHAVAEVQSEVTFTTLIIISAYIPLFTLEGVEQKMFQPMAYTVSFALLGSLLMALTVAPVLCSLLLRGKIVDREPKPIAVARDNYRTALQWAVNNPLPIITAAVTMLAVAAFVAPKLGTEFLPHLDEGNLWIRMTMPPTISASEAERLMPRVRAIMASYQPVKMVVSQDGRPDDGTDSTGFYNAEFFVDLKPYDQWKGFKDKSALVTKMSAELSQIPGTTFGFSQNIEDNVEEAVTGVKGGLAVKLFGTDLDVMAEKAAEIQAVMNKVPGVVDCTTFSEIGEPQIQINPDRTKIARYGLNISDVQNVIQTCIGSTAVTQVEEGEKLYNVVPRLNLENRNNVDAIRNIRISTPTGQLIPLSEVAAVNVTSGASFIYREAHQRYIPIKFNVRGRAMGDTVADAERQIAEKVKLPEGYFTVFGGEYENLQRAEARLAIIVPITLMLIFIILFMLFGRASRALLVMVNVPLALIGGILALYVTHVHLSVSAAVGFIALFGIATQNGVIMVSYFEQLRSEGVGERMSIIEGAYVRLRPVLMTAILASIGLLPAAVSTGIGSDVQKPLAIVIIGGLVTEPILTLFVLPVMYSLFARPRVEMAMDPELA
jgi:cobalt-zinc-cadmium resistance protein CzcA